MGVAEGAIRNETSRAQMAPFTKKGNICHVQRYINLRNQENALENVCYCWCEKFSTIDAANTKRIIEETDGVRERKRKNNKVIWRQKYLNLGHGGNKGCF